MKVEPQSSVENFGAAGADTDYSVEAVDLSFTYQDGTRAALRAVGFKQARGEMIGIMGASGAGKSTLAKCLNRIIPEFEGGRFSGSVSIGGRRLDGLRVCDVAAEVGMVFQDFEAQLFSTNVAHEVAFAMEQIGMDRAAMNQRMTPALEAVGLRGFEHRDPTSLSGGEKQRLAIASVLALSPRVIVLDEPTTDLDPEGKAEVFALISHLRERGLSLIVIEHETEELRRADRVILMREGAVISIGPPAEVMINLELLEQSGVHPPSLNRALEMLGIGGHAESVDDAYAAIVRAYPRLESSAQSIAREPDAVPAQTTGASALATVENVSFNYTAGPQVLDSISLAIMPGDFLAIVGQNGSGKTTLAKHIVGLLKPVTGRVLLDGRDRSALRAAETAREAAYVFQNPDHQIFAATVWYEVAFGPRNFKLAPDEVERRCVEVLDAVGLLSERESDPFLLSKGERQRLAVASVLALRPRLLILDEPTTGLDYREQRRMMALVTELNRSGIAIVVITHTPWLVAEYAQRVALIRKGRKLFDGRVREFFADEGLLKTASFRPPEVTRLARRFGTLALSPRELADWVKERV
ncbi:MAG: energy-coupling factor transporter ATPase [Candidatus Binataceae bacterium]